jgi:serine/threonine-protein kinase
MGTVQYLSPEQASGHSASPTTDIYSLGIVAYEALAGRRPFTGESQVAIAMAQINEAPPELPVTVSEPVRNLVYSCIAKNPADRPASAAHLARAAQALRRGDVAAAAASVPAVVGNSSIAALAGPNYGRPTAATTVLSSTAVLPTATRSTEPPRRNKWTWPLIAVISLLAVILIGTIVAILATPGTSPAGPSPSNPSATSPTPSATPSTGLVQVTESDFLGKTKAEVSTMLDGMKLGFQPVDGDPVPADKTVGTAESVAPTGNVTPGTVISVQFYVAQPAPPAPAAATYPAGPYLAGSTVTISWNQYGQCPTGYDLTGYDFTVSNGTASDANPIDKAQTTLGVQLGAAGQTTTITYVAHCAGLDSDPSGQTTILAN